MARVLMQVPAAVPELLYVQPGSARGLLGILLDLGELFPEFLVSYNDILELLGIVHILVEIILDTLFNFVHDPAADLGVSQLVLGLALEHRLLELYGDAACYALTHILA